MKEKQKIYRASDRGLQVLMTSSALSHRLAHCSDLLGLHHLQPPASPLSSLQIGGAALAWISATRPMRPLWSLCSLVSETQPVRRPHHHCHSKSPPKGAANQNQVKQKCWQANQGKCQSLLFLSWVKLCIAVPFIPTGYLIRIKNLDWYILVQGWEMYDLESMVELECSRTGAQMTSDMKWSWWATNPPLLFKWLASLPW